MMYAIFGAKGGVGTSVVAACLALIAARDEPTVIVDLAGDLPTVFGMQDGSGPGVHDWLNAGDGVPIDSLRRLELPVAHGLSLVPRGGELDSVGESRSRMLGPVLAAEKRLVIVDCGIGLVGAQSSVVASSQCRLVVTRGCFLAVRRMTLSSHRPSGVVLIAEPGRALGRKQIEHATGLSVACVVPCDVAVARSIDAGLLASRMPAAVARPLARTLINTLGGGLRGVA